ncbi:MAG: PASTA domain-containing protein [Erysipelotrichaceae bacterium]|nr:PASTA domain-containing protein [Erysipelotrichaceae bacterium]
MFNKKIDSRIKLIFLFFISFFVVIFLKVVYIEMVDYKKLSSLALDLWSRDLPIEANRGLILDRNGVVLADNITTTSLVLVPSQIKNKEEVSKTLASILNVSLDEMKKHVYKNTSIERVHPEGRRLDYETADKIESYKYDGVYLVKESKRYYPYGTTLSHVLGYVGIDNQGLGGIELIYDKYLTGENGAIKYFSDAKGNKINLSEIYLEPASGMNITLTIDINIQLSLERELNNVESTLKPDNSLAVVIDPNTGEILAMASRPTFNPNSYKLFTTEVLNRNLPIWMTYEPGSTFKIITMSSAVEEKVIDIYNDHFYDSGSVHINGTRIGCWKSKGHGDQTFLQVLENSCNPGFVKLGQLLGKERLFSYFDLFGFGSKTGIDLNGEATGIMFPLEKVGELELVTSAFGQGISVTPIQQVVAVSSVVNGGNLYKPYIVKSVNEPITNSVILENKTKFVRKTISKETSEIMKYALESVVARGGGRYAYIDGYRVGGKTGTAQKVKDGVYLVNNYIMSFMSVVPSNNPEAILYVAIDNPKNTALLSSYTTAPVARKILLDIIDALDIKRQENQIEKVKYFNDEVYYVLPDVVGKTKKEAVKDLFYYNVEYSGSGDIVLTQSPKEGTYLAAGSTVRILLGN